MEDFSGAVAEDDNALLLVAAGSFRKEAMGGFRKGSDASRMLDQEMSARLLHLACKHDAVRGARLLLEGGHGITACPVHARDQLMRTPLHVDAETHSVMCIELLLSKNARTDCRLVDGRPLFALEIVLKSRRIPIEWSTEKSFEDLQAYLHEDLKAVKLLAEKTREVGEMAYRYAMEGCVTALAMQLLVVEAKISSPVSVLIDGIRTKRSIDDSVVDEVLSNGDALARECNEKREALLREIQLLNQFGASSWKDPKIDKRSLPPLLRAAKFGDMEVTEMILVGDVDVNEADPEGSAALRWCPSSSTSAQGPMIVWLLPKDGARVCQRNKLGLITPAVHIAAAKGNYKAVQSLLLHAQDCVGIPSKTKETPLFFAVKNGSVNSVKLLLRFGANPRTQNLRRQRPINTATSQDMRSILNSENVVPWSNCSLEKNHVMKKERPKELLNNDFDDYDSDEFSESDTMLKTSGHRNFLSSNCSAQRAKGKSQSAPKQCIKFSQVIGSKSQTRYLLSLLLLLVLLLITPVDAFPRRERSESVCVKRDLLFYLLPHDEVCPLLDLLSEHWIHSKSIALPEPSPQQRVSSGTNCDTIAEVLANLVLTACCIGPWISIKKLQPVNKLHQLLFFRVNPVKMWFWTLLFSINYYAAMISYGCSSQRLIIRVANIICCVIFLALMGYLSFRHQVATARAKTSIYCLGGVALIAAIHIVLPLHLHPSNSMTICYFEIVAIVCMVLMYFLRWFTLEATPINCVLNILAALSAISLICTWGKEGCYKYIVICSCSLRVFELLTWALWTLKGRNPIIVPEDPNNI